MAEIHLETTIDAPIERVFDLSRSIDAHTHSAENTKEKAIAGRTSGLIEVNETVTWEARHFGIKQRLTVKVTRLERPFVFEDEMIDGAFSRMHHRHTFESIGENQTKMIDRFSFSAPLGILGRFVEIVFLERYMKRFLLQRNLILKDLAESAGWKPYLERS